MRLFLGVPVPHSVAEALASCARQAQVTAPRYTKLQNMHLTLYFLGQVGEDFLPELLVAVRTLSPPDLRLTIRRLGTFPRAGVLFAEVDPAPDLMDFQQQVAQAVERFAARPDPNSPPLGDYHPHITLARRRSRLSDRDLPPLPEPIRFRADCLHLYESRPTPTGSQCVVLHTVD